MAKKLAWYKDGLRFGCTGCGKCCTGFPGRVWITPLEIKKLAKLLELDETEFLKKYTRTIDGRPALKEHMTTYDCVFLKDKMCTVYEARPSQCRTFPFWKENLTSKKAWLEAGTFCEGINHKDAPLIPFSKIESTVKKDTE